MQFNSGSSARTFKSGLIFAAADSSAAATEAARSLLAWEDINDDEDAKARLERVEHADGRLVCPGKTCCMKLGLCLSG